MSEIKAKKTSILTIEKELLSSYIEAITDLKKVKDMIIEFEHGEGQSTGIVKDLNPIIDKHVNKLKSSGIWE